MRRFASVLLLMVLLSGCFSQQMNTTISPDGSGNHIIRMGFSQQFLDFAEMGSQSPFDMDELNDQVSQTLKTLPPEWEAKSEKWRSEDNQYQGIQISLHFSNLAMLQDQLSSSALSEANAFITLSDVDVHQEGGNVVLKATLDNNDTSSSTGNEDLSGLGLFGGTPTILWTIQLPGKVKNWTNQESGKLDEATNTITYQWDYPLTQPETIEIQSAFGAMSQKWLLVGALVGIGVLLLLAGLMLVRQRRKPQALPAGNTLTPPVDLYTPDYPVNPAPIYPTPPASQGYQPRPDSYQPSDTPAYPTTSASQGYQPSPDSYQPSDTPAYPTTDYPTTSSKLPAGYEDHEVLPTKSIGSWLVDEKDKP